MKIALTGASGHLGSALIPALAAKGHSINALVRDGKLYDNNVSVNIIQGELLSQDALRRLMQDCDALIHCAAVISVNGDPTGDVHRTNVEGTKLVMETARECGIKRVVHISSIHAFRQHPDNEILDEQRALVDESAFAYDRSKREGQQIALSMISETMEVLVMNPTSIIGPYDHKPSKMGKVIMDLYNKKLPFVFDGGFDFCDSRDVADAVVNALTMGRTGHNYLLGGKWHSLQSLARLLAQASDKKIKVYAFPVWAGKMGLPFVRLMGALQHKEPLYTNEALAAIATGNRCISSKKATDELGYRIRPLETTLADTIAWFRQNGYLV